MTTAARAEVRVKDRRLFASAALVICLLVFAGFAQTYYLHAFFPTPKLSLLLHVHGAILTGWIVLFVAQICLIAARRVKWHRWLGYFGAFEAAAVVVVGTMTTWLAAQREVRGHTQFVAIQVPVLGLELTQMLLFACFAGLGILWRKRVGYHKRLMLLATMCLLPNPIVRLPIGAHSTLETLGIFYAFVLICVAVDTWRQRRLHPAFGWGAAVLIVGIHSVYLGAFTETWIRFASRLVE